MNPQTSPDRDQATPLHSGPGPQQQPISTADSQRIIDESFTQTPQASSAPVTTLGQTATTEATRAHYASMNSATYQQQARGTYAQPQQRYGAPQTGYPGPSPYGPQQPYPYGQTGQQAPYGYPQPGDAYVPRTSGRLTTPHNTLSITSTKLRLHRQSQPFLIKK